jgi:putative nucleotidyltransferase with HDIG domain
MAEKLRAEGLSNPDVEWRSAFGLILWATLVASMYTLYLKRFQPEVWRDARRLLVAGGALLAVLAVSRAVIPGHSLLQYGIPFAAIGMMVAILVGGRTAAVTQVAVALHAGMMSGLVEMTAYALLPALLGTAALRRGTTARDFAAATGFVILGNLGVLGSFLLASTITDLLGVLELATAGLLNGVLSGLLAFAGIFAIGHLARITTVFELRELGDPNHPLLRQLLLRTPGTYHHSLLVANLAERAAEVIGADSLVARIGAYYHDIGKMRNPSAFIENQAGEKNPHDALDPLVSAQIVAAHVRDGLALAERYSLPAVIKEMIPGHHGTGLVKFFYQRAAARGEVEDPDAYRYPGPRPRSREAAVVALADGVEASVRSLPEKTQEEIRRMVDKIVTERMEERQLDECELTLADIQKIKDAFVELLVGVYHERIPYPEDRITQLPPRTGTRAQ